MSSLPSDELITQLTPFLGGVSRLVARGSALSDMELETLLAVSDFAESQAAMDELRRWSKLLIAFREQPSTLKRNAAFEALRVRGIPEAPILLALDRIVPASPATVESEVFATDTAEPLELVVSIQHLNLGKLASGQVAHAEFQVSGGPGEIFSESPLLAITPTHFDQAPRAIQVQAGPLPVGHLDSKLIISTPHTSVEIPVFAIWEDIEPKPQTSIPIPHETPSLQSYDSDSIYAVTLTPRKNESALSLILKLRLGSMVRGIALSDKAEYIAVATETGLFTFDKKGQVGFSKTVAGSDLERPFECVALTPDGKVLAASTREGDLYRFQLPTPQKDALLYRGTPDRIQSLAMDDRGELIAVGHVGERLSVIQNKDEFSWTRSPNFKTWNVVLDANGTRMLAGSIGSVGSISSTANILYLLDAISGEPLASRRSKHVVSAVTFFEEAKPLAAFSGESYDNQIILFNQNLQQRDWVFESDIPIICLASDRQGRCVIAGTSDGTLMLFDLKQRVLVQELRLISQPITCAAMTTDGQFIVAGSVDTHFYLFQNDLVL